MDLFRDVNLLSRIAPRCMEVLSSTGFSLCGLSGAHSTIHRLKPVPLDRAGPALERLAVKPAGDFQSDCGWLRGPLSDQACDGVPSYFSGSFLSGSDLTIR